MILPEHTLSPSQVWLLYEVTRQFSSSLDLDDVLGKVLGITVDVFGAKVGSIFLLDAGGKVTRCILARENLPSEVRDLTAGVVMEKGFGGWVCRNASADIIIDTNMDSRWHMLPNDHLDTRSAIAAPLLRKDRVIGVITLTHSETGHFGTEQIGLIQTIAGEAAMAVENASLYKNVKDEHAMLRRLDELKNDFVAHVAHDLKSPLSVIYGYAGLLHDMGYLKAEDRGHLKEIITAVERMKRLITTILDINRIEMGIESEFEKTAMEQIIHEAVKGLIMAAEDEGISLSVELQEPLPLIFGAPVRLSQAVTNLIGNALKFTTAGGSVRVAGRAVGGSWLMAQSNSSAGSGLSAMNYEPDRNFVEVSVTDTGPGIPAELQAKLFQKFSKLGQKETCRQEGHGLGLAIVKSVIDAHKGHISIDSEPGRGSCFSFRIPAL